MAARESSQWLGSNAFIAQLACAPKSDQVACSHKPASSSLAGTEEGISPLRHAIGFTTGSVGNDTERPIEWQPVHGCPARCSGIQRIPSAHRCSLDKRDRGICVWRVTRNAMICRDAEACL